MRRINKLKLVLDEGKIALGSCIDSYSPAVMEVAGYSGLDFVRIDTEYSWRRDDALEHMIRAAVIAEVTPMIRVEKGNHYLVSKALQIGANAILVSDVATYREAVDVVKSAKFAPKGVRGYSSYSFSGCWGTQGGEDWVNWSNTEILVGIMVENEQIMTQIDDVFAIEGLDFCLFGPSDYCMSLGLGAPKKGHPKVEEAISKTIDAATKYNKAVGIGIGQPWEENARRYIDLGCRFLEISHDLGILSSEWRAAASSIRTGSGTLLRK
jgi:2-keto-3-deoxy-L-rhamnonate aldolase RhmA